MPASKIVSTSNESSTVLEPRVSRAGNHGSAEKIYEFVALGLFPRRLSRDSNCAAQCHLTSDNFSVMPNTGRSSGACHACRRMKIKCGEERPGCTRCIRANRQCPGYSPNPDNFRYATPAVQGKLIWSSGRLLPRNTSDTSGSGHDLRSRFRCQI